MNKVLLTALLCSLTLNACLLYYLLQLPSLNTQQSAPTSPVKIAQTATPAIAGKPLQNASPEHRNQQTDIAQLTALFDAGDPQFYPLLVDALRNAPNNWQLLLLEARWVKQEEPLSDAIIQYFKILDRHPPAEIERSIHAILTPMINQAIEKLRVAGDWDTLAAFLEPLYQYLPDNRVFIMSLAEAYGRQQKFTLMENVLASVLEDDPEAQSIRRAVYPQESQPEQTTSLPPDRQVSSHAYKMPLLQTGEHFLAPIRLNQRQSQLLVDTGASITTITSDVFEQLQRRGNYRDLGNFSVNTAGGKVEARMITLDAVEFGPYQLHHVSVLVLPPDTLSGTEGLLGMNILKRFHFKLDQFESALLLDPIH